MLVLDTNLLSDYLTGMDAARAFLQQFEDEPWSVPSIVLYESLMGAVYGHLSASPETVRAAVGASMTVLDVTEATAVEAANLQRQLQSRGLQAESPDALIAAPALEHGGRFATNERFYWNDEVQDLLPVAEYRRS